MSNIVDHFEFNGKSLPILFRETLKVKPGVACDVYVFDRDDTKDLGIIRMQPGSKTPLQKVLSGEKTIEGHMFGKGKLVITRGNGNVEEYEANDVKNMHPVVTVMVGDTMRWYADTALQAYELCYPPYADGRYENIEE